MTPDELQALDNLLAVAQSRGVLRLQAKGIFVEFFQQAQGPITVNSLPLPGTKPKPEDMCQCGHSLDSHSDTGECYHSCPPDNCTPDEPKRTTPESAP